MIRLRPVNLDFANPAFFARPWVTVLFTMGIIACLMVGIGYWKTKVAITEARLNKVALEQKLSHQTLTSNVAANNKDLSAITGIVKNLQRPWNLLLQEMESSVTDTVELLRFEPDSNRMVVTITGECEQLSDAVEFVQRLAQTHSLAHPTITAQKLRQTPNGSNVEFSIQADWRNNE